MAKDPMGENHKHRYSDIFQISSPFQDLLIYLASKNTEIKVNQTLLYKVNLKMFGLWVCNYNNVPQIPSKDAFWNSLNQ